MDLHRSARNAAEIFLERRFRMLAGAEEIQTPDSAIGAHFLEYAGMGSVECNDTNP